MSRDLTIFNTDSPIRKLLDSLTEGVVVVNDSGRIVMANRRCVEMFGFREEELVGQALDILLPNRFKQDHRQYVSQFFKKPLVRPMGIGVVLSALKKDGQEVPVEISLSYLDLENQSWALAFITDISVRQQLQDELKQRNVDLDRFAQTLAHDISGALTGIVGFSDMLLETSSELSNKEQKLFLSRIAKSARKVSNIVNELLLFARLRKGNVHLSEVDMARALEEALARLSVNTKQKKAVIRIAEPLAPAIGYGPWIEEVWFNYVGNAIKYGGKPPSIEIGCTDQEDGMVRYWVKDNGAGIRPEQHRFVFQDSENEPGREVKGHGLGLSIVKRIMDKLDGRVALESATGTGSTFSFYLKKPENNSNEQA